MGSIIPNVGYDAFDGGLRPLYGGNYYPPGVVKATSATVGTPGTWAAVGSIAPAHREEAVANGVTTSPATAWTGGKYMQGREPGTAGRMYWNGTAWATGAAP